MNTQNENTSSTDLKARCAQLGFHIDTASTPDEIIGLLESRLAIHRQDWRADAAPHTAEHIDWKLTLNNLTQLLSDLSHSHSGSSPLPRGEGQGEGIPDHQSTIIDHQSSINSCTVPPIPPVPPSNPANPRVIPSSVRQVACFGCPGVVDFQNGLAWES